MIKCASICGFCVMFSVYANIEQKYLSKVRDSVKWTGDTQFYVKSRLMCTVICCQTVSGCGCLFSKAGHCQCQHETGMFPPNLQDGDYELWMAPVSTKTADKPIPCAVVFEEHMYWYKDGRSDFEVKTSLTGDNVMYTEYIQSTKTFYWVTEHGEKGIQSALLSFGKIGPEKQILLRRTRVEYFKFDLPGRILISASRKELSRSTMKGGKTQSLHHHTFIWQLAIDERNRSIYFADLHVMFVIDYNGKSLKKIHNRQPGDIFYNEADKRLYWVDSDTKTIISQTQDPLGDQHAIQKIDEDTFFLTIHNQVLYLNEYAERGFTVITLEGKRLPSFAADVVPTDEDAHLVFL